MTKLEINDSEMLAKLKTNDRDHDGDIMANLQTMMMIWQKILEYGVCHKHLKQP